MAEELCCVWCGAMPCSVRCRLRPSPASRPVMRRRLALCASDGVWHCMSDDEAIETVERTLSQVALSRSSVCLFVCLLPVCSHVCLFYLLVCGIGFVGVRKLTRFCAPCSLTTQTFAARTLRRRSSCRHSWPCGLSCRHAFTHAIRARACGIESASAFLLPRPRVPAFSSTVTQ